MSFEQALHLLFLYFYMCLLWIHYKTKNRIIYMDIIKVKEEYEVNNYNQSSNFFVMVLFNGLRMDGIHFIFR